MAQVELYTTMWCPFCARARALLERKGFGYTHFVQRPAGNLPVLGSSFVGRHRELAEIRRQVGASRLVTLTGPGGVGKTRLAIQAGGLVRRAFAMGVNLVDASTGADPDGNRAVVARALGADLPSAVVLIRAGGTGTSGLLEVYD